MNTRDDQETLGDLLRIYDLAAEEQQRRNGERFNRESEHEAGVLALYRAVRTDWVASVRRPLATEPIK